MAVGVLTFLNVWNELFISLVLLHSPSNQMVTPTIAELTGRFGSDIPVIMAGLLLGSIPTLVVYLLGSRLLVRGMIVGSVR